MQSEDLGQILDGATLPQSENVRHSAGYRAWCKKAESENDALSGKRDSPHTHD